MLARAGQVLAGAHSPQGTAVIGAAREVLARGDFCAARRAMAVQ